MIDIDPAKASVPEVHRLLLGGVAPRPIALVSTVSSNGTNNLSPFSFFNAFGANPPTVAFSPARRGRDGSFKDTYNNLQATGECVIQAVTYAMVRQVSLASAEFAAGVDEFVKSGLTPIPSDVVKPMRVAQSPFQMECLLKQMIPLGEEKGSGNLALCEVVRIHVEESIIVDGVIDPTLIDLVGRNSAEFYTRASNDAIFTVERPAGTGVIGYDGLPEEVKQSTILSANNLAQLANCESMPSDDEVATFVQSLPDTVTDTESTKELEDRGRYELLLGLARSISFHKPAEAAEIAQHAARCALDNGNVEFGWMATLYSKSLRR